MFGGMDPSALVKKKTPAAPVAPVDDKEEIEVSEPLQNVPFNA